MQRLKEGTRERIVAAGRDEFMRRGFAAASMREIARGAGIAVGNLYRYFAGKEALFEAVVAARPTGACSPWCGPDRQLDREALKDFRSVQPVTDLLLKACQAYRAEFLILVDRSAGTRYENTRDVLVRAHRAETVGRAAVGTGGPWKGGGLAHPSRHGRHVCRGLPDDPEKERAPRRASGRRGPQAAGVVLQGHRRANGVGGAHRAREDEV